MKKKIMYTSIILVVLNFFSKILAFLKETALAYCYGSSIITDAYLTSQSIVNCIFTALTGAIVIGYITNIKNSKEADKVTNSILNFINLIFILLIIFIMIFSKYLVKIFAPGFTSELIGITTTMIRFMAPFCLFYGFHYIIGANLQVKNSFWYIGVQGILANIVLILSIVIAKDNILILSIGYGLSILIQAIFVFIIAVKKGFKLKINTPYNKKTMEKIISIAFPIFFIDVTANIILIVDKMFASQIGVGIISNLNYSNKIIVLITTFFVSIISTVLLPTLVSKANEKNYDNYKKSAELIYTYILLLIVPITIGVIFFSKEIVQVIFMRGAFNINDLNATSTLLFIYAFSIPSIAINSILKNQLYSLKEAKKALLFTISSFVANVFLNFVLIRLLGYIGLAISSVVSSYLLCIIMFSFLFSLGNEKLTETQKSIAKIRPLDL